MRIVFMGTPDFAVPSLKALVNDGHEVVGVYTQPDRPAGRGRQLRPSPVKAEALKEGLSVYQPEKIKKTEVVEQLKQLNPDCIVVVAYGQILSRDILSLPRWGCINVHASLLPLYRGAAPIHWAVINGERVTGVTTMVMDEGLDTGDILLKSDCPISEDAVTGEIHDALSEMGGTLLIETLKGLEKGTLKPVPQRGRSTYAPLLKREHERIDWLESAENIHNKIRGLNPWPTAYTTFNGERLKVWKSKITQQPEQGLSKASPGEILRLTDEGLLIQTGLGTIELTRVQPAGKQQMKARDFLIGRRGKKGDIFGN